MDLRYLGSDRFGEWLGSPAGMPMRRPGWTTRTDAECAFYVPRVGDFVASFNGRGVPTAIYVDVTDQPRWDGGTVRAVDLDLDVVQGWDGTLLVDDEDEFAEHQVEYGYPAEVVDAAQRSCDALVAAIAGGEEPWAGVGHAWCALAVDLPLAPLPVWAAPG
jgi:protein associated with RNAse G/E